MRKYENKFFSILGDSISTLEGYSTPEWEYYKSFSSIFRPEHTWWGQVIAHFGGEMLVNNSFAGSRVTRHPMCEIESYSCGDERTSSLHYDDIKPDVIMVFMGMNDWGGGVLPTPRSEAEKENIAVFSVAYDCMLKKLQKNYPQAEIWCFTLPIAEREEGNFPFAYRGVHMEKFCDVIRTCAEKYGCRTVDLYRNDLPYSTVDGEFHPDIRGMKTLAEAVIEQIEGNVNE